MILYRSDYWLLIHKRCLSICSHQWGDHR